MSLTHSMTHSGMTFSGNNHGHCGAITKRSRGNKTHLVICDYATSYQEALALPMVVTPRLVKELLQLLAWVGIPDEILTDQGANLTSSLLEEL